MQSCSKHSHLDIAFAFRGIFTCLILSGYVMKTRFPAQTLEKGMFLLIYPVEISSLSIDYIWISLS